MCYPKPGPRCSAHAAVKLATVKLASISGSQDFAEYLAHQERLEEAQLEYDITPAGLKDLQDLVGQRSDPDTELRYAKAKALRADKLALLREDQKQEQAHTLTRAQGVNEDFCSDEIVRSNKDAGMTSAGLVAEAEPWFNQLNDDELSQIHWMTDYGSMEANTHIAGTNDHKRFGGLFSAENLESRMVQVDSALSKFESHHDEIVYRGFREGSLPSPMANNYRVSDDVKKAAVLKSFTVGEVYKSDFYMPTSVQPEEASRFADFGCVMEIKTRKAAPVSAISEVPRESEKLIGRNSEFKVVAIKENIMYGSKKMTVVQLEQL